MTATALNPQQTALIEGHAEIVPRIVNCLLQRRRMRGIERDELISEGHLGLIQAARSFDSQRGADFKTHAHSCIKNALIDFLRSAGRQCQSADLDISSTRENNGEPDPGFDAVENKLFIQQALESLPPQQRQAIELSYLHELPQAEVATRMDISERQVRNLVKSGLEAMRRAALTSPQ